MSVVNAVVAELKTMRKCEGLVLQGCGGDAQEWIDGINEMLTEEKILLNGTKFSEAVRFQNDGLTCLLFKFEGDIKLDIGKLAIWRLKTHSKFGGTSYGIVSERDRSLFEITNENDEALSRGFGEMQQC